MNHEPASSPSSDGLALDSPGRSPNVPRKGRAILGCGDSKNLHQSNVFQPGNRVAEARKARARERLPPCPTDGGAGNDILRGGAGIGTLYGGTGNDTCTVARGDGVDTMYVTAMTGLDRTRNRLLPQRVHQAFINRPHPNTNRGAKARRRMSGSGWHPARGHLPALLVFRKGSRNRHAISENGHP
jgi:hypothetical protein